MASKRTYLREVNPHLICPLCRGYLIDATTVVECLHSFCRSCILKHLQKDARCPSCKILLNTAKPNIKADKTLQDIVYKLVPGLYHKEMRKRREFYSKHPDHGFAASLNHLGGADSATPEQRGEDVTGRLIFAPEDAISLSLEYLPAGADPLTLVSNSNDIEITSNNQKQKQNGATANRRYLQCPALVTIAHLKKFLGLKYSVDMTRYNIDICHRRAPLPEHWTLMDVAYIFAWKRNAPIRFFYRITQEEQQLEAPPNDRPSTPGLGASQPITTEQANEPENDKEPDNAHGNEETNKQSKEQSSVPNSESKPQLSTQKSNEVKRNNEQKPELLAKRTSPSPKKSNESNVKQSPVSSLQKADEELKQQVKSPIKIMKNSDGRYQVLRPNVSVKNNATSDSTTNKSSPSPSANKPSPSPPATPTEFSVVSIGSGTNSNGVKITLKQCQPGSTNTTASNSNSKKPKVISNVLLRNSTTQGDNKTNILEQMQEAHKQEKQKRKVTFMDVDSSTASKQPKKGAEQTEKKQFLQGFRLAAANAKQSKNNQDTVSEQQTNSDKESKNEVTNSDSNKDSSNKKLAEETTTKTTTKKRQTEVKTNSTNIADRLNDAKHLLGTDNNSTISSSDEQPIDVYAFPNDPPAVPAGAVKRKCPPGLPIFDVRKKQYQPAGKRTGVNTAKNNGTPVKCYRNNQITKPSLYAKPPPSPARTLQSVPNPIGNVANVNANNASALPTPTAVSSTSPKNSQTSSPLISNDTRNLLDGCGLNIPASLSITLTAPKSPSRSNDSPAELRGTKDNSNNLEKLSPSITLNDKSVDPRVLKALKAGQMRMPLGNAKTKSVRQQQSQDQQESPTKKKKEDNQQQPKNILDLSGNKKMDLHPLKIPTPLGKYKVKLPTWSQANSLKPPGKDDVPNYSANGQVVTLTGGQRFYRAPPGSLTPAVHRIGDIPTPTRTPVYAPCFSSPSASPRPTPANLSSVFPSLQSLYALSQAPSLEQFSMDSRMRLANAVKDNNASSGQTNTINSQIGKSHLAAQCAPVKPARSSICSFAVPIAKQSVAGSSMKMAGGNSKSTAANSGNIEMSTSTSDPSNKKNDSSKEESSENCASSTEEGNSQQGSASPRVTSTASPSPPPNISETINDTSDKSSKTEKRQLSSGSEVTSSNKSPESPDSSSVVTESIGNLVDSTKSAIEKNADASPKNGETKFSKDEQTNDAQSNNKTETEFKKPMTSEALQKRFLAAFPSNEWANNPVAAEQFGNFLKSLSTMQAEAQPKNTKKVE